MRTPVALPPSPKEKERALSIRRRRFKHTKSFQVRLAEEAEQLKAAAEEQPLGSDARELLLRRARQAETAAHIDTWLKSPRLQPPKALANMRAGQKN
jgi:hypothetical protein